MVSRRMGEREQIYGRCKDGRLFPAESSISKLRIEGQLIYTVVLRDVTERKQAEIALKRSEMMLAEAQKIAQMGSWDWDVPNNSMTWSAEMYRIYGVTMEEFDLTFANFINYVHPDDRPLMEAQIERARRTAQPLDYHHRIIRADGVTRTIHVRGRVMVDDEGNVVRMVGTGQDVTELKEAEARLERYIRQLAALHQVGQAVTATLALPVVLQSVLDQLLPLLRAEGVAVFLLEGRELLCAAAIGLGAELAGQRFAASDFSSKAMASGKLVLSEDANKQLDPGSHYLFQGMAVEQNAAPRSLLAAPLALQGTVIGVIEAVHSQPGTFDKQDGQLLATAASWTAVAIDNARQHARLQRRLQESETLAAISQELSESLDLKRLLQRIMRAANRLIPQVDAAVLHLYDTHNLRLQPVLASGIEPSRLALYEMGLGESVAGQVFLEGMVLNLADIQTDSRRLPVDEELEIRSVLAAPIPGDKSAFHRAGVLSVFSYAPDAFASDDERLLATLGVQAAVAIQNSTLFEAEKEARRVAEILRTASISLSQTLDLREVLNLLLANLAELVPFDSANVMLLEGSRLVIYAQTGYEQWSDPQLVEQVTFDLTEHPMLRELVHTSETITIPDTRLQLHWQRPPGTEHVLNWMGVPVVAGGHVVGVFSVDKNEPNFFEEKHCYLAETLTSQAATAIQNARLFEQLTTSRERLRQMAEQIVAAQEEERQRLSRELHDEAGQALTGLKISLALLQADMPRELGDLKQLLDESVLAANQAMEQIRSLSHTLHPPALSLLGLTAASESFCRDFSKRTRLNIEFSGDDVPSVPGSITICFYRFLQEALTNSAKHAQATLIRVTLGYDGREISLTVADDGQGFNPATTLASTAHRVGLGLLGMQERFELLGGMVEIVSAPGHGARLTARAPWRAKR
jgi:PAS domain S-box-containing protein